MRNSSRFPGKRDRKPAQTGGHLAVLLVLGGEAVDGESFHRGRTAIHKGSPSGCHSELNYSLFTNTENKFYSHIMNIVYTVTPISRGDSNNLRPSTGTNIHRGLRPSFKKKSNIHSYLPPHLSHQTQNLTCARKVLYHQTITKPFDSSS